MEIKNSLSENNYNQSGFQGLSEDELMQIEGGILPIIAGAVLWKGFVCGVGVCTALYGAYRLAQQQPFNPKKDFWKQESFLIKKIQNNEKR